MIKHPKQAYGIFEDGHTIRIVQMMRDKEQLFLVGVDRVEIDNPLYHRKGDEPAFSPDYESNTWEDNKQDVNLNLDEFETNVIPDYRINPLEAMLLSYDLKNGVIAININDDNIIRSSEFPENSRAINRYAKANLSPDEYKNHEWQYSEVQIANRAQLWFHHGHNLLLELLQEHRRKNKLQLYYQLADANDVAITDYFRLHGLSDQRTLLIYLGQDYRKAFVFDNGIWNNTLVLQISQHDPEPDIIYSKLSLAMDSAGENDPERIVICGDHASRDIIDYLQKQYHEVQVEPLSFGHLMVDSEKAELFDSAYLSQYALPIALACKALYPDDDRFSNTNFLPGRILESQKVFKIAWHGFLVLALIFLMVLLSTVSILKAGQTIRTEKALKRELDFTLAQKRKEAAEIQQIRTELDNQEKSIEALKTILEGKNFWTEILNAGNRVFASHPTSWLTNLKKEKEMLFISGVTTRRASVVDFANSFPNSQIRKVTLNKIRNTSTWAFEITADFPKVDWTAEIDKDLEALRSLKSNYGETAEAAQAVQNANNPTGPVIPISTPRTESKQKTDKRGRVILSPLPQNSCPLPREELTKANTEDAVDYKNFVLSINKGNMWEYRDLGLKFIKKHPQSELQPAVRWWLCYRMYLDKDYSFAAQYLEPMLRTSDRYYPYSLLLNARILYAQGSANYEDIYLQLKNDYARHALISQINKDLAEIKAGGAK